MNEILDLVHEQKTDQDKVKVLQEYANDALKTLLIWNFDESIISLLPTGEVPYQPNESPLGVDHSSLRRDYKNLYNFVKGGNDSLAGFKRENMYIQMLEGLHKNEAELLIAAREKKLHQIYKGLSAAVVKEAFGWNDQYYKSE